MELIVNKTHSLISHAIFTSVLLSFLSDFRCIVRYPACYGRQFMKSCITHGYLQVRCDDQKSSSSLTFLQNTDVTRRAEHNSWPQQRASAKTLAFPSWETCTSPQVIQQIHRLLPEEIKFLNKQRVMHFGHVWKEIQWVRIIQCHHELALKRHKTVYSEWNSIICKHSSFFFPEGGGRIDNFLRIIKERLKNMKRRSRPGFFCRRVFFSLLLKDKKLKQMQFFFSLRLLFTSFWGWENER